LGLGTRSPGGGDRTGGPGGEAIAVLETAVFAVPGGPRLASSRPSRPVPAPSADGRPHSEAPPTTATGCPPLASPSFSAMAVAAGPSPPSRKKPLPDPSPFPISPLQFGGAWWRVAEGPSRSSPPMTFAFPETRAGGGGGGRGGGDAARTPASCSPSLGSDSPGAVEPLGTMGEGAWKSLSSVEHQLGRRGGGSAGGGNVVDQAVRGPPATPEGEKRWVAPPRWRDARGRSFSPAPGWRKERGTSPSLGRTPCTPTACAGYDSWLYCPSHCYSPFRVRAGKETPTRIGRGGGGGSCRPR